MKKRFLATVLALAMVLAALPAPASAADAGALSDLNGKVIALTNDVTISSTIMLSLDSTLDLNGHTVNYNGSTGSTGSVFRVISGTFTLKDSTGGGKITGGKGSFYEDSIVSQTGETSGGGVLVESGASFKMEGGSITGNQADRGGGIYIGSGATLSIYGGSITNNKAIGDTRLSGSGTGGGNFGGGGIFLNGTATISPNQSDIVIFDNTSRANRDFGGGGIFVGSQGKLTLTNAVITNNHADGLGGGIASCVHSKVQVNSAVFYANTAEGTANLASITSGSESGSSRLYIDGSDAWQSNNEFKGRAQDVFAGGLKSTDTSPDSILVFGNRFDGQPHNWTGYNLASADAVASRIDPSSGVITGGYALALTAGNKTEPSLDINRVIISDNKSAMHGGGIACGGTLILGEVKSTYNTISGDLTLDVQATLEDGALEAGQFTFELLDSNRRVLYTAKSDASGKATLSYTSGIDVNSLRSGNIYTFYVRQQPPATRSGSIGYDDSEYEVKVTVAKGTDTTQTIGGTSVKITDYSVDSTSITKGGTTVDAITFTNTYAATKNLTVALEWVGDTGILPESANVQLYNNGTVVDTPVALNATNSWRHTFTGLTEGQTYTVKEVAHTYGGGYTADALEGVVIRVRNTANRTSDDVSEIAGGWRVSQSTDAGGNVTITNTWGGAEELGSAAFTVTAVDQDSSSPIPGVTFTLTRDGAGISQATTDEDGNAVFSDLTGGTYTLTETVVPAGYPNTDGRSWTIDVQKDELISVAETDSDVFGRNTWSWRALCAGNPSPLTAAYTKSTGSLTITNEIVGDGTPVPDAAKTKRYTFILKGSDNSSRTVTIIGNDSATLNNLPVGIYTVTEDSDDAQIDGYSLNVTVPTVEVKAGETAHVTITNTYTRQSGSLTIQKLVNGGGSAAASKAYTFTVTGPNGYEKTVSVTGAGSVTLNNLPTGVYTVKEDEAAASISGYNLTVGTQSPVEVEDGKTVTSTVTNTYEEIQQLVTTVLTVNKVWKGDEGIERPASVKVQLLRDGELFGEVITLSASNSWSHTWTGLDDSYSWAVDEVEVPAGYTRTVTGSNASCTITNTYKKPAPEPDKPSPEPVRPDPRPDPAPADPSPKPSKPAEETPSLGDPSPIQSEVIRTDREEILDWIDRLELPDFAQTFYDVMAGNTLGGPSITGKKQGVFEVEQNFVLPDSDGSGTAQVDWIEVVEFSLTDMYANGGGKLNSTIFEDETFYKIDAAAGDRAIDFAKLALGSVVKTSTFNGVYVTKLPYDSTFDTKKKEACEYIAAVHHAFDRDHPEVFWLSGKCKARIMVVTDPNTKEKEAYFFLVLVDKDGFTMRSPAWTAEGSIAEGVARRDAAAAEILKSVTAGGTADKIKQLNKWLTEHNQYNTTPDLTTIGNEPHECLAALEGRVGTDGPVCDGYSRAFKLLCDRLSIPCTLETGWAKAQANSTPGFHMWNLVQVGGTWYGADITWDDPVVAGSSGPISGRENERYLLVGADTKISALTFAQSHVVQNQAAPGGVVFNNGPTINPIAYSGVSAPAFADVRSDAYYYDGVLWAVDRGITAGTSATTFSPDAPCTQVQILTFLWRAAGKPSCAVQLPFALDKGSEYARDALCWAYQKGMIGAGFNQNALCTRANAVQFLWQAAGSPAASGIVFTDVPAGYAQAVAWAAARKITAGTSATTFSPDKVCDRGQIVTFLCRDRA